MSGIEIAALLTSLLAIAAFGTFIWQISDKDDRYWLSALALLTLPMSPLAFYCVRMPLDHWLATLWGHDSPRLVAIQLWYAPLTEEPAKLIALLITWPFFHNRLSQKNFVTVALVLGLAFAVGEMWLIANTIAAKNPQLAAMPFYEFGGFLGERLMTCVTHSAFTAIALWGLQRDELRKALGVIGAMTAHFIGNFPIFLMNFDFGKLGKPTWTVILQIWLIICTLAGALLLGVMGVGSKRFRYLVLSAQVKCPECGEVYRQPILGANCGVWRYERCRACRKWHWITLKDIQ